MSAARGRLRHVLEGGKIGWSLRKHATVVALTPGLEVFSAAAIALVVRAKGRFVVADFLMPRSRRGARLQRLLLRRVDHWVCIRRGDIVTLGRRYSVDRARTSFAHFPVAAVTPSGGAEGAPGASRETDVYAAGSAHRDWDTLFAALGQLDVRAVISCPATQITTPAATWPSGVEVIPPQAPEDGRGHARRAKLVVLPMSDTELPSGPLVLLDAMALGVPVIATDCNGTRDYIRDGVTGWLVPPADPRRLASVIGDVLDDEAARSRVAANARRAALEEYTAAHFVDVVVSAIDAAGRAGAGFS